MISRLLTVLFLAALLVVSFQPAAAGVITANGWYEGEEITLQNEARTRFI
jgi:hypothetical protein